MFARPGLLGMGIGRLGLVAANASITAQAMAILAKYGSAANLYLPGIGEINGITAGNWLDSAGTTAATVDNPVGLVVNARGGQNLSQATPENKPILRRGLVNQFLWSNGFTNASWSKLGSSVATGQTDPGGGTGGYKLVESAANSQHYFLQNAVSGFGTVSLAFIVKAAGRTKIRIRSEAPQTSGLAANFDLAAGTVASGSGSILPISNGFFLCVANSSGNGSGASGYHLIQTTDNSYSETYTGDGSSGIIIYQAALIQGTLTAQQILTNGGIPLTTTAAASSAAGSFAWQFNGSNNSFTSALTPGNAGFFCTSANVTDSGVLRTLLGAGAGSDASSGVWINRSASNALTLHVGNGITRNSVSAAYPVATNAVASAGWDSSTMFVGVITETSGVKTVNCTSSNTMNVGVLTGMTNPMIGNIGPTIIMSTVLPDATERTTLRKFIASLSGVTM